MSVKHVLNLFFLLAFLFVIPRPAWSETPHPFANYLTTFDQISLPNFGRASCIMRDDLGFIWIGTTRGLCRYDGYEVRIFSNGPSLNTRQQVITAMVRLNENSLLLGTLTGLWEFNLKTELFTRFLTGYAFSDTGVSALAQAQGGTIWIGSFQFGLFAYDPGSKSVREYTTENGLSDNGITSMLLDSSGRLWVGTFEGLSVLDPETSQIVRYRPIPSDHITALCENEKRDIWIGTDDGVHVLQPESGQMHRLEIPSRIQHTIHSIVHDPSGRMWLGVSELGLLSYTNGAFTQFTTPYDTERSLAAIRTLYLDPVTTHGADMLLWIGTRSGINKLAMAKNPFTSHIRDRDSLRLNRGAVLSLFEDHTAMLWVSLWGGGLNGLRRANGTYQRVVSLEQNSAAPRALPNNDVGTVLEDRTGRLWAGTHNGLVLLDRERNIVATFRHVEGDSSSLIDSRINTIYEDHSGTIWISTPSGLSELVQVKPPLFRNHLHDPADTHDRGGNIVTDILEDRHSNLWIATLGKGLFRHEPDGSLTQFTHPADSLQIQENWINNMHEGRSGNLWLNTQAELVSFDPESGQFTRYVIDQLNNAYIFGIFEDRRGELWLSTSIGLAKFNPVTNAFVRYDERHGIPFRELRSGFYRNPRGKLMVGGLDGFVEFDPDSVSPVSVPPEIAITGFSVFDKELFSSVYSSREIQLSHDQNFFSVSFAALDYINPQQNRFAYMMEDVDKGWVQAGTRNYASYTHLDPGTYTFHVKGSNSTNAWNDEGISLSIIISPPYWKSWWFRILVVLAILSTLYAAYRYRLRKALEVERMRLRIADDLHDDVGSNLSTIAMVSRVVQRAPELSSETRGKLNEIYDTAIKTSEGMKDIVWFIKPKDDTVDDLILRMKDTASSLLADVKHEFHAVNNGTSDPVTIDFKRNFYLAFKEILTNIIRHASATSVEIRVEQRGESLQVTITDNGMGFDLRQVHGGNGLGSLQNRAKALGGVCEVKSTQGQGTLVRFSGKF